MHTLLLTIEQFTTCGLAEDPPQLYWTSVLFGICWARFRPRAKLTVVCLTAQFSYKLTIRSLRFGVTFASSRPLVASPCDPSERKSYADAVLNTTTLG